MTGGAQSCRNDIPSINYRYNPHGGASFDFGIQIIILSTADLISGAGQLWNFASSSLLVLRHKSTSTQKNDSLQKENTFYYPAEEGNIIASISSEGQNVSVNLEADSHVSPTVNVQKDSDSSCLLTAYGKMMLYCKEKGDSSVMIYELRNIYGWMSNIQLSSPTYNVNSTEHDKKRTDYCFNARETASVERSNPEKTRLDDGMTTKTGLAETQESSSREYANNMMKTSTEYLLRPIQDVEADGNGSIVPTSDLQPDSNMKYQGLGTSPYLEWQHGKEDELSKIKEGQERQVVKQESSAMQIFSLTPYKLQYGLTKQEHAFAGAFAGIFVSLCLHPMDTVKTVVQSCCTDQRSIQYLGKSILHERGLSGLYCGIASNIVSSAPISAIYTFSYESVKGALLPLFIKVKGFLPLFAISLPIIHSCFTVFCFVSILRHSDKIFALKSWKIVFLLS
ncbi:Mitochondrial carrier domain-containing protein [Cynara cardunculus var. scolymus]|uniref:Mitochondrial carrier domain-containing protein n=1 Tax=Cynara cardunculus var. scolymus TaxID=59895 RepID=A0A124SBA5_CYNCS|nr:Mitochondrial carrier domain-containing protein [Cynara cardunculus var. scolymus]